MYYRVNKYCIILTVNNYVLRIVPKSIVIMEK
jgi:hypothetical protein